MANMEHRRVLARLRRGKKSRLEQHHGLWCWRVSSPYQASHEDGGSDEQQTHVDDSISTNGRSISKHQQVKKGIGKDPKLTGSSRS